MSYQVIPHISALRERLRHETGIAFVPTMGNLHDGHLALVELARQHGKCVVVSIFVNPLQFGPKEDLANYPRTLAQDCAKLEQAGVDVVFTPDENELFPAAQQFMVDPPPLANELCGAHRRGHFKGVVTIVLKLFNIMEPDVAVFGKKDYQQWHLIRQMVDQLNLPIKVIGGETMRAADGLALSSRNGYLSATERAEAVRLYRHLGNIQSAIQTGDRRFSVLELRARTDLQVHGWRVDYISVRAQETLAPAQPSDTLLVVLAAAWIGRTRLIDNLEICVAPNPAL